jgi:hypothetical protein
MWGDAAQASTPVAPSWCRVGGEDLGPGVSLAGEDLGVVVGRVAGSDLESAAATRAGSVVGEDM